MTERERKILWLGNEINLRPEGRVIRPLPRNPRTVAGPPPKPARSIDPVTGKLRALVS